MKPIFEKERKFLEKKLGVEVPNKCWRKGQSILLNADTKTLIYRFEVQGNNLKLKTNKLETVLKNYSNKTWEEEIKENEENLRLLEEESINKTIEYINNLTKNKYKIGFYEKNCEKILDILTTLEIEYSSDILSGGYSFTVNKKLAVIIDGVIDYFNINIEKESFIEEEIRISNSGGKDSTLLQIICKKVFAIMSITDYKIDFFNTSNESADTYKYIKTTCDSDKLVIHNPSKGWYQWLKDDKNYFLPTINQRTCCDKFKEGKLKANLDKKKPYLLLLGARKFESTKRKDYDWDLNEAMKKINKPLNMPSIWKRFLPVVNWTDKDVWLYLLKNEIKVNEQYAAGFNRCGCIICPYSSNYVSLLIKEYYKPIDNRFNKVLEENYNRWNVEKRLKWTLEEWQSGKWKAGISREHELITKAPTKERIAEVASIKNISIELAKKYFKQKCSCSKQLNPDEVAMYLKTFGRYEGKDDNRTYLCKKCLSKELGITFDQYRDKVIDLREGGCNLF